MKRLIFIIVLTALAVFVVWPQRPGNYIPGGDALPGNPGIHLGSFVRQGAKLGLDLQGGTQLTLQADLTNVPADQQSTAMQGVLNVIERRVNAYGVAEPEIQMLGADRIIVMEQGSIVEEGNHQELMQRDGLYAKLAKMQFHAPALIHPAPEPEAA